jgi:hypothetical protein
MMAFFDDGCDSAFDLDRAAGRSRLQRVGLFVAGIAAMMILPALTMMFAFAAPQEPKRSFNFRTDTPPKAQAGDTVILSGLPATFHAAIRDAFVNGVPDNNPERPGDVTVRLEYTQAMRLLNVLVADIETSFSQAEKNRK